MKIALAQINSDLGNFAENSKKILDFSRRAESAGAEIVVFPEATLFGYHPMDLLERPSVVQAELSELNRLCKKLPKKILVLFGAFTLNKSRLGKPYFNSAVAVTGGRVQYFNKTLLPTYDVFDDARHIEPGDVSKNFIKFKGKRILVTVCEDIWAWPTSDGLRPSYYDVNPLKKIKASAVDIVINLSASPFFRNKWPQRLNVVRATAKHFKAPMVYVNMVGGQDELIFDGGSFAVSAKGDVLAHSPHFCEDLNVVDLTSKVVKEEARRLATAPQGLESLREALVLGIRDFVQKIGLKRVHLGLSGGIDSALVAALAVDAIGAKNVTALALPGPYSSSKSLELAKELALNLGIELKTVEFTQEYKTMVQLFEKQLGLSDFGLTHENIQSRIRGTILMAFSNQTGSMLLNTTNKSELAVGYGTLYGDLIGGLSVIGDLLKRDVYALSRFYNRDEEVIPNEIIDRAPSAELKPNQKDEDSLPPYAELDKSVINLVENLARPKNESDHFLIQALAKSEFKRRQSPPILKVRAHSFGQGRRMPIANSAVY